MTPRTSIAIRLFSLTAGALLSSALPAQTPSYFPLQVGNSWLYRQTDITTTSATPADPYRSISVQGQETVGDRQYFRVLYFGRSVLLRDDPSSSTLVALDRLSGAEQPWLSLGLDVGATFPTTLDHCSQTGKIESRTAQPETPAGNFNNAVEVSFQGNCNDAGTTREIYAPYVGPVLHEETSFAGPRRFELVYYHVSGLSGSGSEISFTLGLDSPQYPIGGTLNARLTLRSTSQTPVTLHFPSGQSYDLMIYNEKGDTVYTWSANRAFPLIVRQETFGPGEHTYGVTAPLTALPPGPYKVRAYLTTQPVMYVGEVSFEVVGPQPAAQ